MLATSPPDAASAALIVRGDEALSHSDDQRTPNTADMQSTWQCPSIRRRRGWTAALCAWSACSSCLVMPMAAASATPSSSSTSTSNPEAFAEVPTSLASSLRASRSARALRQACEKRFRQTDFALDDFRSPWLNNANLSAFVSCLYELRTRHRPTEKRVLAAGIHYPTLLVTNHQSPPVSTSGSQWCWLDEKGTGSNGLSHNFCCDPRKGPRGDLSCWDDYFNFELCCRGEVDRGELPHYFVAPAYDINVGNMVRQMGTFDLGQSYALQSLCQLGDTVVDVGANVGGFTVPLAERVGKNGKVYAFEPFRKIYQHLNANVALNGLTNVYAFNNALGTEVKELDIHAPDLNTWNFPSAIRVDEQYDPDDALKQANLRYEDSLERIYIRPLDSFRIEGNVTLIKIDVEFMELQVVLGAKELIRKHQPLMWVENEPFFDDPPDRTFVETMEREFDYVCKSMARLELLCTPSSRRTMPRGFQRVLQHLSGAASESKLWTALAVEVEGGSGGGVEA